MKIKRPLLLWTGGFVLGEVLILQGRAVWQFCSAMVLALCLLAASGCFEIRRGMAEVWGIRAAGKKAGRSFFVWLLPVFVLLGMVRGWQARELGERELGLMLDGKEAVIIGRVSEIAWSGDWAAAVLSSVSGKTAESGFSLNRIQVYLDAGEPEERERLMKLRVGNHLELYGTCSAFDPARNPGEFDFRLYYRSMKLHYRMFAEGWQITGDKAWPIRDFLYRGRRWISARLAETAGEDAGMFQALMLGEKAGLSEEVRRLYQDNGIAHMLAISGLHLSLVSMAVYGLLRKLGAGYGLAGICGGSVLAAFAVLAGGSPSLLRALIMALCGFLAAYLGRTYDLVSALSLAGFWLLWDSPYLVCQAGVQLSFGALMGIGAAAPRLASPPQNGKKQEGAGHSVSGIFVSLGMQAVTLPMVLFHFFQFPLYGVFLNLLTVPLMGLVVASGAASVAFCGLVSLKAGRFFIGAGRLILDWFAWCCQMFGQLPGSSLVLGRPELWQIGIYYGGLSGALFGKKERRWFLMILAALCLFPLPAHGLSVTFLDVGQGDGIVLQTREAVILADGGSSDQKKLGENRLEPFLKSRAIRQIDYAIVSHADLDHTSGLIYLLEESEAVTIRNLILPAAGRQDKAYEKLVRLAEARRCRVHWMEAGEQLVWDKLSIRCLYPAADFQTEDRNEHSLVLHVSYGAFDLVLTGDMTEAGEEALLEHPRLLPKEPEVLKISHHGSKTATTEAWLDQLKPSCAVVSYGNENRYGHPNREVMERLYQRQIPVYETGRLGAVEIRTDGVEISIKIGYNGT